MSQGTLKTVPSSLELRNELEAMAGWPCLHRAMARGRMRLRTQGLTSEKVKARFQEALQLFALKIPTAQILPFTSFTATYR